MTEYVYLQKGSAAAAELEAERAYPWRGMLAAVLIILLSPFTSSYLNIFAFLICLIRIERYGGIVFSTDYCVLSTVSLCFQLQNGVMLLPYLCLLAAIWFVCTDGLKVDASVIILIIQFDYLLLRMHGGYSNLVLCFSQLVLLRVIIRGQNHRTAALTAKAFCMALLVSSLYAYLFRAASPLVALKGSEAPAYWMSEQTRFYGLFRDPNYYMALLVVAIALLIKLRLKGELGRIPFVAILFCFAAFGVLTYSKSFAVLIAIVYGMYLLLLLKRRRFLLVLLLAVATALAIFILLQTDNSPLQAILYRFSSANNLDDLTTGRSELYARYINAINADARAFLLGHGLDAELLVRSPHNLYLEILYYLGSTGLGFFLVDTGIYIHSVHTETSGVKDQTFLLAYFPLITIAILFFSLAGMFSPQTYVMFFLAMMSMLI